MADATAPIAATTNRIRPTTLGVCWHLKLPVTVLANLLPHCFHLALFWYLWLWTAPVPYPSGPQARLKNKMLDCQWSILVFGTNACLGASVCSYTLNFGTKQPRLSHESDKP